jgi:hypothetical protein
MIAWGIVSTATAATTTFGGLVGCRLLLGIIEAAYFVGFLAEASIVFFEGELTISSLAVCICCRAGTRERSWSSERRCSTLALSYPVPFQDFLRRESLRISTELVASRHGGGFSSLKDV